MKKKLYLAALLAFVVGASLWAGDTAVFVDLGFSPDGRTYMFGQYGVQSTTLRPWADLYIVNVTDNSFVPGGKVSYVHDSPVVPGQDGSGALYTLIAANGDLAKRYNISFLLQGQPLYVAMENGSVSHDNETISFRNFDKGDTYEAVLSSEKDGAGMSGKSSFFITLDRSGKNGTRNYMVGNPRIKRQGVSSYRIRKVVSAPRDGSLIFIIEMKKQGADGSTELRYMVEALKP